MRDAFNRNVHSMRISVTDRCNMRCSYCVSGRMLNLRPEDELLTLQELETVVAAATRLGFDSFRFTGGEPLVRPGLTGLLARVAAMPGVRKLSLSTNGSLLAENLDALQAAGVRHLNISLDSLQAGRFREITRGGDLGRVLQGIRAAMARGGFNIKLNAVIVRGTNDDELLDLAALTLEQPIAVRFIEYMPLGAWRRNEGGDNPTVACDEMLARLRQKYVVEENVSGPTGEGPARYVQLRGAAGFVGLISPVYQPFCDRCNRMRLTADGNLKSCLLHDERFALRPYLRSRDFTPQGLEERLSAAVLAKPERHEARRVADMSTIGG
ncbi:MAG: GTP 3',8-cyclase MoaA [Planctomycetes bacterium]|nr:GTP 3',8-cyclase MoaA [Planctomycetota bacterium]